MNERQAVREIVRRREYLRLLGAAGLAETEVEQTHRVHPHAGSAIIRARKPRA